MSIIPVKCSCCKGTKGKLLYSGLRSVYTDKPYSVVQCLSCQNGITTPSVEENELDKIYSGTYLYPVHLLALGEKKYRARAMAEYVREITPATTHPSVLEIGCMFGYLLQELKNEYKVKGIDIGNDAVSYCIQQGLDVRDISIEKYLSSSDEKFDVIVISHVLEHLLHPDVVLIQLHKQLNKGGRIYILVPNYKSFTAKIFGRFWGWWQVPVHINHFTAGSLEVLANNTHYEKEQSKFRGGDSLMLLLNFVNLFSITNNNKPPGFFQKTVIGIFTRVFRYWYKIGNEELVMVLKAKV
ncbi:MAG: class I SAM-dependent methyltransferase [Bacteroidia bacterium]|nr:class I SAM-dependent methyltransferase [Bacteroidia bacterium]